MTQMRQKDENKFKKNGKTGSVEGFGQHRESEISLDSAYREGDGAFLAQEEGESCRGSYWFSRGGASHRRRWGRWAWLPPLTLQHRDGGLSTDPGGDGVLVQVVTPRVVAGSAFIRAGIVQHQTRHSQHAGRVAAVRRADGDPPLPGAVPQLPERVRSIDLRVPPLDFRGGGSQHVAAQLKGVARELGLRQRRPHETRWRTPLKEAGEGWKNESK